MVKISGHMVTVVVVDHNQGLMTKTKNGIFGYQESEGKLHKNFVHFLTGCLNYKVEKTGVFRH